MKHKNKFSIEDKERIVQIFLAGENSYRGLSRRYTTSPRLISLWVKCYLKHGRIGLSFKHEKPHARTLKLKIAKEMLKASLSLHEASACYLISPTVLSKWKKEYEIFGELAFKELKPRGQPIKMTNHKSRKDGQQPDLEKLIVENQYLRAENDYLKKLKALIQKEEAQLKENKRKSSRN